MCVCVCDGTGSEQHLLRTTSFKSYASINIYINKYIYVFIEDRATLCLLYILKSFMRSRPKDSICIHIFWLTILIVMPILWEEQFFNVVMKELQYSDIYIYIYDDVCYFNLKLHSCHCITYTHNKGH